MQEKDVEEDKGLLAKALPGSSGYSEITTEIFLILNKIYSLKKTINVYKENN